MKIGLLGHPPRQGHPYRDRDRPRHLPGRCGPAAPRRDPRQLPEIVGEGVTGRLVHDVDRAVAAVESIHLIDRAGCRAQARERFGAERMVTDYLAVYERLLADNGA